jgi:Holliday junction resolvase RusA-like endonuclease
MLPFEFVIPETPVSVQARDRKRLSAWKERVRNAASASWPREQPPVTCSVRARVTYYYDQVSIDSDNILKPLLDALCGVVYRDDAQVTDVSSAIRSINGSFRVRGMSRPLAEGFVTGHDFLHIRIEEAPDQGELP